MSFLTKLGNAIAGAAASSPAASASATASRSVARERLSVILASQRGSELLAGVDMEALQRDVLAVVEKHVLIARNRPVNFNVKNEGEVNLFEMSVELSDVRGGGGGGGLGGHHSATISVHRGGRALSTTT